ncbi:pilus assembly protein [Planctomycetaceae bacterium SCGC AG-212-F19]|nr:pilus assembly protein [Planctomycetaceae bacterium SCGC AG-212-F19]
MFPKWRERLGDFLKSEDGPTAVEYAVMLALIIIVCLLTIQVLGSNSNKAYDTVGKSIGKAVTT